MKCGSGLREKLFLTAPAFISSRRGGLDGVAYFDAGEVIRILIASLVSKGAGWTAKSAFGGMVKLMAKPLEIWFFLLRLWFFSGRLWCFFLRSMYQVRCSS